MFNVCYKCGQYSVEKEIDPSGPFAICPHCGHRHPFLQLPLFVITGASATGKSTINARLPIIVNECVFLESDILWRPEFINADNEYRHYWDTWLRVAKNVAQGGRPVVLSGSAMPHQLEPCPERRYFADIHYLALVCDDNQLRRRLQKRPSWRESATPEFIEKMVEFNQWFKDNADKTTSPLTLLDTTRLTIKESALAVRRWIRTNLNHDKDTL